MPPKRIQSEKYGRRAPAPKGYIASVYDTLTSPDNASVVRSIAAFGVSWLRASHHRSEDMDTPAFLLLENMTNDVAQVAVAFLSSSWNEFLLPA